MDSFVLVAYASLTALRTLLLWLLACLNFTLDSENLFCWYKWKNWFLRTMAAALSSWKPWSWVRFDPILTMRDIYINSNLNPLTEFTSSSRRTEFKNILPWNFSQMNTKTIPISTRTVITMGWSGAYCFEFIGETTAWSEFPRGENLIVENTNTSIKK